MGSLLISHRLIVSIPEVSIVPVEFDSYAFEILEDWDEVFSDDGEGDVDLGKW